MIDIQSGISIIFIVLGIVFILTGSIGLIRLPDFFTRSHAVSMSDMLGIIFVIFGLIIYEGFTQNSLKLLLIVLFVALANPIGIHALSRSAIHKGLNPFYPHKRDGDSKP